MPRVPLSFVTCATDPEVLTRRLLASPCLARRRHPLATYAGCDSAAAAFNAEMVRAPDAEWLVWVHQDVFLPESWDTALLQGIAEAERQLPNLAVAGVYGIAGAHPGFRRAGQVVDRGTALDEPEPLPAEACSLDELLLAVRADSGLLLDPALGFDFYGTDLVLSAREAGWRAAVVRAPCEHHSTLPRQGRLPSRAFERLARSAAAFERKWAHRLPLQTSWVLIEAAGDSVRFLRRLVESGAPP
jgi:hypothetical protein